MAAALTALLGRFSGPLIIGALAAVALLGASIFLVEKGKGMERAKQAAAIAKAQQKADALSAELEQEQAKKAAVVEKKVVEYVTQIRTIPGDPNCPADERDRATSRGVRDILGYPPAK